MKRRNINKLIVFTLSFMMIFSTIASASINNVNTKSSMTSSCYVDPFPKEGGVNWP